MTVMMMMLLLLLLLLLLMLRLLLRRRHVRPPNHGLPRQPHPRGRLHSQLPAQFKWNAARAVDSTANRRKWRAMAAATPL